MANKIMKKQQLQISKKTLLKGLAIFTVIETAALAGWLKLTSSGSLLAFILLLVGLILEHIRSSKLRRGSVDQISVGAVSLVEAVTWAGWLMLTSLSSYLAGVALFIGLAAGHVLETNMLKKQPLFTNFFKSFKNKLILSTTGIETAVGIVWLSLTLAGNPLLAIAVLFGGLFIEHSLSTFGKIVIK
jgi:hypothetical protein